MKILRISYGVFKQARGALSLFHTEHGDGSYTVVCAADAFVYLVHATGPDATEFVADLRASSTEVGSEDDAIALATVANQRNSVPAIAAVDSRTGAQMTKGVNRTSTYGRDSFDADAFDIPAGTTVVRSYTWPYKVDFIEGLAFAPPYAGDVVRFQAAPTSLNLVAGTDVLASVVSAGQSQLTLAPALLALFVDSALIDAGLYELTISEGATEEGPFLITGYDLTSGVVTLGKTKRWTGAEPAPWSGFANAFSTAAVIKTARVFLRDLELDGQARELRFGSHGLDSAPLPANVALQCHYTATAAPGTRRASLTFHILTGVLP